MLLLLVLLLCCAAGLDAVAAVEAVAAFEAAVEPSTVGRGSLRRTVRGGGVTRSPEIGRNCEFVMRVA